MPLTIAYLLKLSISLSLVYLFYQILLRKLTFYHLNRWYLMGYSLLSFFIPFFNISPLVEAKKMGEVKLIQYIPVVTNYTGETNTASISSPIHAFDKWDIMLFLLLTGIFIFTVRLIIQLVSLRRLRQKSTLINDAGTPIYHVDKNIIPFSFGNAIYVNQQLHQPKELEEIILHEYVHVKQKHSIDILLMELVSILNWFNPFAWLLRHAVRQNLEFIADDDVLKTGMDKKAYQYHLLQVVGLPQYRIANSFNLSSLKKRIAMMNKFRSAKIHLIKFLFILPLLVVLLLAFRERVEKGVLKIISSPVEMKTETLKNDSLEIQFSSMGKSTPKPLTITKNHIDTIPSSKKMVQELNDTSNLDLKKVLVLIDDKEVPKGIDWVTIINPDAIKSMSVYKGRSAIEKYGQKAKYGVISITTKNNQEIALNNYGYQTKIGYPTDSIPLNIDASQKEEMKSPNLMVVGSSSRNPTLLKSPILTVVGKPLENPPLYFIDDKEVKTIKELDPNQIESINVLKDSMAIKKYGEKGRNGVILIKTKKLSYHSPSQSDKSDLQFNGKLVSTIVHPTKNQPMAIFKNDRSGRDTVILIADTIEYNKTNLRLSGTMTIYDSVTASIKGNFSLVQKGDIPFVVFNGKRLKMTNNFKSVNGHYRVVTLSKELAMAKYGDRRAGNGAIEISSL